MGFLARGRKIDESADRVRYAFERFPGDPDAGIVTIPVDGPDEGWTIDDGAGAGAGRPKSAVVVAVKAVRTFRRTGSWPDEVVYAS